MSKSTPSEYHNEKYMSKSTPSEYHNKKYMSKSTPSEYHNESTQLKGSIPRTCQKVFQVLEKFPRLQRECP